jgi:hypothetical protein
MRGIGSGWGLGTGWWRREGEFLGEAGFSDYRRRFVEVAFAGKWGGFLRKGRMEGVCDGGGEGDFGLGR